MSFKIRVSFLIFCLDDLLIDETGVFRVPHCYCVAVSSSFHGCKHLLYIMRCSCVGCIYIYNCSVFFDLLIFICSPLSLVRIFILKSILSDMNTATSVFFWFPFAWNIFFHPLTLSLSVSLNLRWVSCRQRMCQILFF